MFQQTITKRDQLAAQDFDIVFNLFPFIKDFFLVEAYVVSIDQEGYLAHIKQKANHSTIQAYNIELTEVRRRLFDIIDLLQPPLLVEKFRPPRKKKITLEQLLEDRATKKKILKYVHTKVDELLKLIVKNDYAVSWDVERKVLVKDFLVELKKEPLQPHLHFEKTDQSVKYRFLLEDEQQKWSIHTKNEVAPITNHPAWIYMDGVICQIAHVNGNMVKPFRSKEEVIIPNQSVKTYFETFILKVASKVEIDAIGFDLINQEGLKGCTIELVEDFRNGTWGIFLHMNYESVDFPWNEKRAKRLSLNFADGQNVKLIKVHRDFDAEKKLLKKIEGFGLVNFAGGLFQFPNQENDLVLFEWLVNNQESIKEAGFRVEMPQIEGRGIYFQEPKLKFDMQQQNDWFDLYGSVIIGEFTIPFVSFAAHIKQVNRFYELPNGEVFIIPLEWMNRYKSLFQFGKKEKDTLRLAKSQYMLLHGLEELKPKLEISSKGKESFKVSEHLKAELRPYQLDGVKWLVQLRNNDLGACLADDMGLGKTLQTIAVLLHAKEEREEQQPDTSNIGQQLNMFEDPVDTQWLNALNALIILPASLTFNWEREIKKFAPLLTIYKHTGPKRHKDVRIIKRFDVVITTYQTVLRDVDVLLGMEFEYIVLDESQQIKNKDSKMFKAINKLHASHKISLSGTPIENSLSDLWAQMHFINPNLLGGYNFFRREFITPIEKKRDEEKKDQLRSLVKPYLLRRTKAQVAKDLPPLTVKVYYSEMSTEQKKLYEKEKSAARNFLLENYQENNPKYRMMVLQSLTKLRQLANHPLLCFKDFEGTSSKFNDIMGQLETVRKGGHKVLMFSSFVQHLELFRKNFEKHGIQYSWLTGDLDSRRREKEIEQFENNPDVGVFFISIKSGGTGLNLIAADYVFILDPWWNPFTEQQAIARAHRIGQKNNVIAFKFITKDTIEQKILKLQNKKTKLAEDIIEQVEKSKMTKGDIEYLLG